jgi:hypothetical protein
MDGLVGQQVAAEDLFYHQDVLARHAHEPAHALAVQALGDLFAAGVAAGAFDVADPQTAGVLCYASMHAFDDGFRGPGGPDDGRLIRAAQQFFRRVAGMPGG